MQSFLPERDKDVHTNLNRASNTSGKDGKMVKKKIFITSLSGIYTLNETMYKVVQQLHNFSFLPQEENSCGLPLNVFFKNCSLFTTRTFYQPPCSFSRVSNDGGFPHSRRSRGIPEPRDSKKETST